MFDIDTNDQFVRKLGADSAEMFFEFYDNDYDKLASNLLIKGNRIFIPCKYKEKNREFKSDKKNKSPTGSQLSQDLSLSVTLNTHYQKSR